MRALARSVRALRHLTDPLVLFSFNRMGFCFHTLGFVPEDLPAFAEGRIALVTGANSGIGLATALALAQRGCEVWMLCRDRARGEVARTAVVQACGPASEARVHLALLDVSDLDEVRHFVDHFPRDQVDVLVHNAGVLLQTLHKTAQGIEQTFATSVVGPFALTTLLLSRLACSQDARVVFVASGGLYLQRFDLSLLDVSPNAFSGVQAYAHAKRAQLLLTHLFAEAVSGHSPITFASMHPGWVDTHAVQSALPGFYRVMRRWLRTPAQGADTVVWLSLADCVKKTKGAFWFDRRQVGEYPVPGTRETQKARAELFRLCQAWTGSYRSRVSSTSEAGRAARKGIDKVGCGPTFRIAVMPNGRG